MVAGEFTEKNKAFRRFLLELILEDSGSREAFARRLGVHPSRITQLTRENYGDLIDYPTITRICLTLRSKLAAKALYERYIAYFVSNPIEASIIASDSDAVQQFLLNSAELEKVGMHSYLLREASRLFVDLRKQPGRNEQALKLAMLIANTLYTRGLQPKGISILNSIESDVRTQRQAEIHYSYLHLRGLGYRGIGGRYLAAAASCFDAAKRVVATWQRSYRRSHAEHELERDSLLVAWDEAVDGGSTEILQQRVTDLNRLLDTIGNEYEQDLAREAAARAYISLGNYEEAQQLLTHLATNKLPLVQAKVQVTKVRLFLAMGKVDEAAAQILSAAQVCEENGFGHYHREVFRLQEVLLSGGL